jgi:hypothetical protein
MLALFELAHPATLVSLPLSVYGEGDGGRGWMNPSSMLGGKIYYTI